MSGGRLIKGARVCAAMLLLSASALAQEDYSRQRLEKGVELYRARDFRRAAEEFRLAAFASLDNPGRYLESLACLTVALKAEGRDKEVETTLARFLSTEALVGAYSASALEPDLRRAFHEILLRTTPKERIEGLPRLAAEVGLVPAPTRTLAASATATASRTATETATAKPSPTATSTPSATHTLTTTRTRTSSPTPSPTRTPTASPSPSATHTLTSTHTRTSSPTRSSTRTPTASPPPSATHTLTSTHTRTSSPTRSSTRTATARPAPTLTPTRPATSTPSPSRTPSPARIAPASPPPTVRPVSTTTMASHPTPSPTVVPLQLVDTPPRAVERVMPIYPEEALRKRVRGLVVLRVLVSEKGEPDEIRVEEGRAGLTEAAVEAVRHWRFAPATKAGRPVRTYTTIRIPFEAVPFARTPFPEPPTTAKPPASSRLSS